MQAEIAITSIGARAARLLGTLPDWTIAATFERSFYIRAGDEFICLGDASIGDGPLNALLTDDASRSFPLPRRFGGEGQQHGGKINGGLGDEAVPGFSLAPIGARTWCQAEARHRPVGEMASAQAAAPHPRPAKLPASALSPEAAGERAKRAVDLSLRLPGGYAVSLKRARIWRPAAWPAVCPNALSSERLAAIIATAIAAAPAASFVHALSAVQPNDPLASRARHGVAKLRAAVADPSAGTCEAAVKGLLGLGHGLTPSGDDVLSGALIMLHALGRTETAAALGTTIRTHMRTLTSPLSCAFLRAACDGEPSAAMQQTIGALLAGAAPSDVIAPVRSIGHTSGFDLLVGVLVVLRPI